MRIITAVTICLGWTLLSWADEPKKPAVEPTAAEKAFADSVRAAQKVTRAGKGYTVQAEGKWKLTGGKQEATGTNTARVVMESPNKLRIEVGCPEEKDPHLVIVSDGKQITRYFTEAKLYSVTACDGTPLDDLQADGVTVPALRVLAVDFLARPDMLTVLNAQTLSTEDLGVKGDKTRGYRLQMANGQAVTVRFAGGDKPVPVEVTSVVQIHAGEKKTYTRTLTTKLDWDFSLQAAAEPFTVRLPADAKKVDDLMEAVHAPDLSELLGKPAPAVEFTGLDGKPVRLADYKNKSIVVVYAWAIWAAPSAKNIPGLAAFVTEYTPKGVTFVAVNAGDTAQAVKQFVTAAKYPGVVALDPSGIGLAAVRATALPAVLIIGKDGTVQSYHRGKSDAADKVKADLDQLLGGKSLVPIK